MSKIPDWALREDGSLGNTMVPKLGMEQEYFARLASERYEKILELQRRELELSGENAALRADHERIVRELRAERDEYKKRASVFYKGLEAEEKDCEALHADIERLEAENATLRAEVDRLSAPVSDEEWKKAYTHFHNGEKTDRAHVNALIAARRTPKP